MATVSNSTLDLYHTCPPGLGDDGCLEATCNSTFVDPSQRALKPSNTLACPICDEGFGGLNCNICQNPASCDIRQRATGRGISGLVTGPSRGLLGATKDLTLTCHNQPKPITSSYFHCDVEQATVSAVFPGKIKLTGIRTGPYSENFTQSGLSSWDAKSNSTWTSLWLEGVEQFYCQATGCFSQNVTTSVSETAGWGTSSWTCADVKCFCIPGTTFCTKSVIALKPIIDGMNGVLEFPCDYLDPSDPNARTNCAFKGGMLNQFLGSGGLPLKNCQFGGCLSRDDLQHAWSDEALFKMQQEGSHLSIGVIAGLVILGLAILALIMIFAWGWLLRRKECMKLQAPLTQAVGLAWEDIDYRVNSARSGLVKRVLDPLKFHVKNVSDSACSYELRDNSEVALSRDAILKGISSNAVGGSLKYIIGSSGAGKSTLVDILGGRNMQGQVRGTLWLDSQSDRSQGYIPTHRIALVDQDDAMALPGYMTVRETLHFAAELRNPENVPKSEKVALVDETIGILGLDKVAHRRVGDVRKRGISGGERRRLSLGMALVAKPKILIADEPTSGLDAHSACRVMQALRKLAGGPNEGTTIVVTIHQPSSEIFYMADSVLLLEHGRVLFDNHPSAALAFCEEVGEPVPRGHNVADHLLDYAFRWSLGQARLHYYPRKVDRVKNETESSFSNHRQELKFSFAGKSTTTTFMTQFFTVLGRYWKMTRREFSGPFAHIFGSIILGLLAGGFFFRVSLTIGGFQNRVGSIFFLYILTMALCMSALTGFSKTRWLVMRERAVDMYSPGAWLASHLTYDLCLLRIIPTFIMSITIYWMVGLRASASSFFQFLLIAILYSMIMAVYNMCLAALIEDVSAAILLSGLYVIFNLGMAGFILNLDSMPKVFRWLQWLSPSKYALEAVSTNELEKLEIVDTLGGVPISTEASLIAPGLFGFEFNSFYRNLIVLSCGFLVGFSLILFTTVWWRMKEKR